MRRTPCTATTAPTSRSASGPEIWESSPRTTRRGNQREDLRRASCEAERSRAPVSGARGRDRIDQSCSRLAVDRVPWIGPSRTSCACSVVNFVDAGSGTCREVHLGPERSRGVALLREGRRGRLRRRLLKSQRSAAAAVVWFSGAAGARTRPADPSVATSGDGMR